MIFCNQGIIIIIIIIIIVTVVMIFDVIIQIKIW